MRIRMLKPFNALKVGKELEQADGVAELWILNGRAERMVPPTTVEVDITTEQTVETPYQKQRRRKKNRMTTA